jgi:glycosyltransferase involved in cell wall biosynthesis
MLTRIVPDRGIGEDGAHHTVVLLTRGGVFADDLRARGVPLVELGMRPGRDVVRGLARLVGALRAARPDVVVSWLYHADLMATLAAPFARRPRLVWHLQGTLRSLAGLPLHTRLTIRVLARLSRLPWAIGVNSAAGRADHERLGYRARRWIDLPNGFDTHEWRPDATDRADVRRELGVTDDDVVIVHVARVHPAKDHATLLAAFALLRASMPTAHLVCVGEGTEALALAEGLDDAVHRLGLRTDVARLVRGADLAVLSSVTEGLPNAVGEAMASGLSCVATDVGDCAALIGPTGTVVPASDPAALAAALAHACALPPAERRALGARARQRIEQHHGIGACRAAYGTLWSDL